MELKSFLTILRRWIWLILACSLVAAGTAYFVGRQQIPIYSAQSVLLVDDSMTPGDVTLGDLSVRERLASTYRELLTGREVRLTVLRELERQPEVLEISVRPRQNTSLLTVIVESDDPSAAATVANRLADVVNEQQHQRQRQRYAATNASLVAELQAVEQELEETQQTIDQLRSEPESNSNEISQLNARANLQETTYANLLQDLSAIRLSEVQDVGTLSVIEPALEPRLPVGPRVLLNTLIAAVTGMMIGLGIAFVAEYLDNTIKRPSSIPEVLQVANLASIEQIPMTAGEENKTLVHLMHERSSVAEAYRMLRTNIRFAAVDEPLRSLVITSPAPSEGKSTTASNLAIVTAQAGQKTILVDADLRRPRQHKLFDLSNREGLTTALLEKTVAATSYLQPTPIPGLRVLTSGPIPPNPSELLGSQRMRDLIHELEAEADLVIVDIPPILAVTDSSLVANITSAVLLVVRAHKTQFEAARRALEQLRSVQARVLGVVLNGVRVNDSEGYYYYYYVSDNTTNPEPPKKGLFNGTGLGARMRTFLQGNRG